MNRRRLRRQVHGFTLLEVMISLILLAILTGGMLVSFAMASKISQESSEHTEGAVQAQQTIERNRSHIACDDAAWFDASCNPLTPANPEAIVAGRLPTLAGARSYTVTPANCGGTPGDCLQVQVTVNWTPPQ